VLPLASVYFPVIAPAGLAAGEVPVEAMPWESGWPSNGAFQWLTNWLAKAPGRIACSCREMF
jgi:hypothetical protein